MLQMKKKKKNKSYDTKGGEGGEDGKVESRCTISFLILSN